MAARSDHNRSHSVGAPVERGAILKPWDDRVAVALAYPNTYHVGMSNLGLHRIYALLNEREDTVCERVFLPDSDDGAGDRLVSIETAQDVRMFDLLAFSVSFEQDYLNVVRLLRLAGIAPMRRDRGDGDPLVVLGGICSFFNPEPLADLFDVVLVGEGEELVGQFLDLYRARRGNGRAALLAALSRLPGVYLPEYYAVSYFEDGSIRERTALVPDAPPVVTKRTVRDISSRPASTAIHTDDTEFGGMHLVEVTRGCGRHCRFCMAGYIYLPPRAIDLDSARREARIADETCGKIGLVGAAISDYPQIGELCDSIEGRLSVSSLRADSLSDALLDRLAASGHKTISIAPEAGSERMRSVINKGISEDDILRAIDMIFSRDIPNLRLYFIIGFPSETIDDVDAIIDLARKAHERQLAHFRPRGRIGKITLSVNAFVPKPHTPFQWEPMERVADLEKKFRRLSQAVRKIGNMQLIHESPKEAYIQALLSRGDRRFGRLLVAVDALGGDWKKAAKECDIDADAVVYRRRSFDEPLPWDCISVGVKKSYLRQEFDRAMIGAFTPPCRVGACNACGACQIMLK